MFTDSPKERMTTFRGIELPAWVNWLAQDADGTWWGFEIEPNESHQGWYENEWGRYLKLRGGDAPNPAWRSSLTPVARD